MEAFVIYLFVLESTYNSWKVSHETKREENAYLSIHKPWLQVALVCDNY